MSEKPILFSTEMVQAIPHGGKAREEHQANAARIVACVNACQGMADPAAEIAALRERVKELEAAMPKKPEPNWGEAPEWAKYWAVQEDGISAWVDRYVQPYQGGWSAPYPLRCIPDGRTHNLQGFDWRKTLTKPPC